MTCRPSTRPARSSVSISTSCELALNSILAHALTPKAGIGSKATMDEQPHKTFVEDGPFANPEAAARELLRIFRDRLKDGAPYAMTGVTNTEFIYTSGGSPTNYRAGMDYGLAQKWFAILGGGTRVHLLPDGGDT